MKLSSFGTFVVRKKGQRIGRNPKTGEEVPISPRRVMVFKPSAILKQRINGDAVGTAAADGEDGDQLTGSTLNRDVRGAARVDKAPDAFRTISEVADDLDVPQHVLRFWETRFTQIKPMKRGGGRRYYRPEDVDLLRGIRHLLYGEGYTIRGVQRILKEHGIKFVQGLADSSAAVSFGAIEEAVGQSLAEGDGEDFGVDLDAEDEGKAERRAGGGDDEDGIDFRFVDSDDDFLDAFRGGKGRKAAVDHTRSTATSSRACCAT